MDAKISAQVVKAVNLPPPETIDAVQAEETELEEFRKKLVRFADENPPAEELDEEEDEEGDEEGDEESDAASVASSESSGEDIPPLSEAKAVAVPDEPFAQNTFCKPSNHPEDSKAWRCQNRRFHLTYGKKDQPVHLPKDEYKEWLWELGKRGQFRIEMAHESSDKVNPHDHTHVVIDFGSVFRSNNCRVFDYKGYHPNIQFITTALHWQRALVYLAKQDPANAHLAKAEEKFSLAEKVWSCATRQDVAKLATKPSEIPGLLTCFDIKPQERKNPLGNHKFRYWQSALLAQIIGHPADLRKIIWIFDIWGACGKTLLLKWLLAEHPNDVSFAKQCGSAKDFATVIQSAKDGGWNGKIFILDFVRDIEDHKFYEPLEGLKDGLVTALKYRGQSMSFDTPHIVVFANFLPEVDRLSLDRWLIYEITHNYRDMPYGPGSNPDGTACADIAALNINIVRRKRDEMHERRKKHDMQSIVDATQWRG